MNREKREKLFEAKVHHAACGNKMELRQIKMKMTVKRQNEGKRYIFSPRLGCVTQKHLVSSAVNWLDSTVPGKQDLLGVFEPIDHSARPFIIILHTSLYGRIDSWLVSENSSMASIWLAFDDAMRNSAQCVCNVRRPLPANSGGGKNNLHNHVSISSATLSA